MADPIVSVADAEAASVWYQRLGFEVVGTHRFAPGLPVYMFLDRRGERLHLSEHHGDVPPDGVISMYVDDVAPIAAEFGVTVASQPWALEIQLTDPAGNRVRIGQLHEV